MKFNKKKKILERLKKKGYIKKRDFNRLIEIATKQNNKEIVEIKNETISIYKTNSHLINQDQLLKKLKIVLN